jgi:hypothetical protein
MWGTVKLQISTSSLHYCIYQFLLCNLKHSELCAKNAITNYSLALRTHFGGIHHLHLQGRRKSHREKRLVRQYVALKCAYITARLPGIRAHKTVVLASFCLNTAVQKIRYPSSRKSHVYTHASHYKVIYIACYLKTLTPS